MMPVYWIEDEVDLFKWVQKKLEQRGFLVEKIKDKAGAIRSVERIRQSPGPVILDLWIPEGGADPVSVLPSSPEAGMEILTKLQKVFGQECPVIILSGNLSVDIIDRLEKKHKIPPERIFPKPLLENERFLDCVTELSKRLAG